jgi:hypothetical protein
MAFLALAMLAIGLSSQPQATQSSTGASGTQLLNRTAGPTAYVWVIPDSQANDLLAESCDLASCGPCGTRPFQPTYEEGCDFNRETGEIYAIGNCNQPRGEFERPSQTRILRSLVVRLAQDPSQMDRAELAGWLTQYDAAYDLAMLQGSGQIETTDRHSLESNVSDQPWESVDDQLLPLFQSLCQRETAQVGRKSTPAGAWRSNWNLEIKTMLEGATNRCWRLIEALHWDDDWQIAARLSHDHSAQNRTIVGPTWADYLAWIEAKQDPVAGRDTDSGGGVAIWSPRQSQVLQIAVSTLNRVAELLRETIMQWLERASGRVAVRSAGQAGYNQPK